MESMLGFGLVWTIYGACGFLYGWQMIPEKYKGKSWTREYIRFRGLIWLFLGVPWLLLYGVAKTAELSLGVTITLMIVLSLPANIYSHVREKKYKALLEEEKESP